jgi:Zn-dependent protease with chaperone function
VSVPPPAAQAATVAAHFHDGQVAAPRAAVLQIDADGIRVAGEGFARQYSWARTRVSERLQRAARLLSFDDGAFCEVVDHAGLDAALAASGYQASWVERLPQRWNRVLLALVALLAAIGVLYRWGLPLAADGIARRIPAGTEQVLGARAVEYFEGRVLKPSTLPEARRRQLQQLFSSLVPPGARRYRLALHDGGPVGANALALPGGTVVLTDQLVNLAEDDHALAGVLAHEIGHEENRHLLRQMIAATVVGAVATLIAGDASGLAAGLPATLANLSYTRDMEREADRYAIDQLRRRSIPLESFASLLQRLQQSRGKGAAAGPAYLSTHPDTDERIRAIRAAADRG